jgi:flavorubredoxin
VRGRFFRGRLIPKGESEAIAVDVVRIQEDLLRFSSYLEPIDLSFNQYLVTGEAPLLVHTGTVTHVAALLPLLRNALEGRDLAYVFISHFESDECGGLGRLLEAYPNARPVCSESTARQLSGFGISDAALVQSPGDVLSTPDAEFEVIVYPSDVHLWEGQVLFERRRRVLFSSDLFMRFGKVEGEAEASDWRTLVDDVTLDRIPSAEGLKRTREALLGLPVSLVAPGHGPCIRL